MKVSVSFNLSSLTYHEVFAVSAASRYPQASHPVATWILRESLFIAVFGSAACAVVTYLAYPKSSPVKLALAVVPLLLIGWYTWLALRVMSAYRACQPTDVYTVELSEEGVRLRDRETEWKSVWKPEFEITMASRYVLVRCGKATTVTIPRHTFGSPEAEAEFVRVGHIFQATAKVKSQEMKGGPLEEL